MQVGVHAQTSRRARCAGVRALIVAMKPCNITRWSEGEQEGSCEMTKSQNSKPGSKRRDYIPVTVPFAATPAGERLGIDQWAHHAVWTDRMLATLWQNKVRGGKWHTLIDKVFSQLNLFCSAHKVLGKQGAAGVDRQTVTDFAEHERQELERLRQQLRDGDYRERAGATDLDSQAGQFTAATVGDSHRA